MTRQKRDYTIAVGVGILAVLNTVWNIIQSADIAWLAETLGRLG